ncbi:MAG: peptidase M16 [Arcobacter sp.]|nr:MAG: peptidase M16 [Arcobacter sp.]
MSASLPAYETQTLDNGLQVVVIPMENNTSVISTDIFYKVGSRNEVMGKSGIAHMLEHMNFKSTDNLKSGQFDEIVKGMGGISNASTGFDYTHYFIKSSTKNLDKSLDLFGELMESLKLKDDEFQPERNVVAEERRWRTDNSPLGYMYFRLFNNAYIYHPYHWTPIGFMGDIQNWKLEDITNFHETFYQPKNAIIIVTGDVKAKDVFEQAKKRFARIKNKKDIPTVHQVEPKQDGAKRLVVYKESEVEMLAITYHIPNYQHKDQPALSAISEMLSSGKSSRLYQSLVNDKRLANQIYAYNMENIDPGLFIFMAVCNPGVKAEEVEKEILSQIEELRTTYVEDSELAKVKISTKADFIYSLESSSSVADLFGGYLARGDLEPLMTYEDNINALTPQDIQTAALKYFDETQSTTVILRKQDD